MNLKNSALVLLSLAALVGCATTSLPIAELKNVPPDRIAWKESASEGAATLLIARDSGFTGSAATAMVSIDGLAAAEIEAQELARLRASPGRRTVSVWIRAPMGAVLHKPRSLEVTLAPNGTVLLRIGFDDGARGFSVWQEVAP